jgi:SPOR domain
MNDLRSPSEDRPYQTSRPSARLAQDDLSPEYGDSWFDTLRQNRWFPLGSVLAAVLIFSGIVSYAYKQGSQTGVNATTPVVAADSTDYKEKPENPGGMDVPFQDAVVFDQLDNKNQATSGDTIESLLPPPEQPVDGAAKPADTEAAVEAAMEPKPATETAAATTATPATETVKEATAPVALKEEPAAEPVKEVTTEGNLTAPAAKTEAAPKAVEKIEEVKAPAPVVAAPKPAPTPVAPPAPKPVAAAPAPVAAPAASAVSSGNYRIQLGAFRDESAARTAWNNLKSQFSQLNSVTPDFPRADLGAKGIFYRSQGKNLSKTSADELCRMINASKAGSCLVTQ